MGASWDAQPGEMVTVIEVGTAAPDAAGRRADDRLLFATDRATAEYLLAERARIMSR